MICLEPTDREKNCFDILMEAQMDVRGYLKEPLEQEEILSEMLLWFGLTERQLYMHRYIKYKRVYIFLLYEACFCNYKQIVELTKCRDELEVIQGIEKIKKIMRKDKYLLCDVCGIVERTKGLAHIKQSKKR